MRRTNAGRRLALGGALAAGMGLWGCATPAVVFVSPDYKAQSVKRVAVQGFTDAPGQPGSGTLMADVFEKYLFHLDYEIVDATQAQPDAVITGSVSELTNTSEQTVFVNVHQEVTEPVYQDVVVQGKHGLRTETRQTGSQTTVTEQSVPETETLPARAGLSVRMVSVKSGVLLWSGSGSSDGFTISSAAEAAASKVIEALQKELANHQKPPASK